MKALGIVRRIDDLGRVCIPVELCRSLGIKYRVPGKEDGSLLDVYQRGSEIVVTVAEKGNIGIARSVDSLGRFVLPIELARKLNFDRERRDSVEFLLDGEKIVIRKYEPGCIFCGQVDGIKNFKGKHVCIDCAVELGK